ncbi:MAG: glycosyl hydrolase [Verrucomicrobia bacterium]|nr:glycosyl hydrolase [Verrucomicrobiota bacterium]
MLRNAVLNMEVVRLHLVLAVAAVGFAGTAVAAPGPIKNPPNWGQRKAVPFATLRQEFGNPDRIYAPFMFWFWDEPLAAGKMAEMARVMASQGFNPGYAHARNSMVGTPDLPADEWLGEAWFNAFGAALQEAEQQGGYLGYCDEYWWPSFQAHGRVLKQHPELRAESLKWQTLDAAGGTVMQIPACFFAVAAKVEARTAHETWIYSNTLRQIGAGDAFEWQAPPGVAWRVYTFHKYSQSGIDGGAVNAIDERLAKAFIEIALEPYAKRMGEKLGKSIPGVFRDHEGDYGRKLAWSDSLDKTFRQRHGQDLRLALPLMINTDVEGRYAKVRWQWFDAVSDLYAANFQAVTDWHEQRGMYTTAHTWEENIPLQVYAVGDHMKLLRALTMPGQDCLGRKALQVHDFKEIASVAEFQHTRAATELMGAGAFGSAGNGAGKDQPWSTFNPVFLKQAINAVTAWGMSHVIPHGVFTTRKLTGNPWPPDWYAENPLFPYLHLWTDFACRASYINSMGSAVPTVLLYNPLESAWLHTDAAMLDDKTWDILEGRNDGSRIHQIDKVYADAINDLTDARVEFLIGDRFYLKQMEVKTEQSVLGTKGTEEARLVRGEFSFRTLVLPSLDILTLEAARKMVDFAKAGGYVFALGDLPAASADNGMNDPQMQELMAALKAAPTFTALTDGLKPALEDEGASPPGLESPFWFNSRHKFQMLQQHRLIDGKDFYWLANNTEEAQECNVSFHRGFAASIWDCETGAIRPVKSYSCGHVDLSFKPLEAYWLVLDPTLPPHDLPEPPKLEAVLTVSGPWKVSFDAKVQPVMEFPATPPAEFAAGVEKPLEDWQGWTGPKFSGLLDYTKTITVEKVEPSMVLDLGRVCHTAEVWVNGKPVGARLWGPYVYDVGKALRPGANEIRVRVANLINNSYDDLQESGLFGPVTVRQQEPAK